MHVAADIGGALLVAKYARETTRWEADPGLATAVAVGWEWKAKRWSFVPELAVGGGVFTDPYGRRLFTVAPGLRIQWGTSLRPTLALHVGWGTAQGVDGDAALQHSGLANDVALGLEVPFDDRP